MGASTSSTMQRHGTAGRATVPIWVDACLSRTSPLPAMLGCILRRHRTIDCIPLCSRPLPSLPFRYPRQTHPPAPSRVRTNRGQPIEIRIGVHSGSVVGGVVGRRMPRFTLFGDTGEAGVLWVVGAYTGGRTIQPCLALNMPQRGVCANAHTHAHKLTKTRNCRSPRQPRLPTPAAPHGHPTSPR